MKRSLLAAFLLVGFFGFSQQKKKTNYKKPVKKVTVQKKATAVKPVATELKTEPQIEEIVTQTEPVEQSVIQEDYELTAQRVLKKSGWIKNRNSALVRGIEGFVKGVYVGSGKIYVLLEISNRTNINYDIESISFITNPYQSGTRQLETEEKIFAPIWSNQPETFAKKSTQKLVYVFDKFTISDNKTLLCIINEIDGERTLTLEIKPKYITNADYVR